MKIKCKRCEYEWETKSTKWYVCCPNCRTPNKTKYFGKKVGEKDGDKKNRKIN